MGEKKRFVGNDCHLLTLNTYTIYNINISGNVRLTGSKNTLGIEKFYMKRAGVKQNFESTEPMYFLQPQ